MSLASLLTTSTRTNTIQRKSFDDSISLLVDGDHTGGPFRFNRPHNPDGTVEPLEGPLKSNMQAQVYEAISRVSTGPLVTMGPHQGFPENRFSRKWFPCRQGLSVVWGWNACSGRRAVHSAGRRGKSSAPPSGSLSCRPRRKAALLFRILSKVWGTCSGRRSPHSAGRRSKSAAPPPSLSPPKPAPPAPAAAGPGFTGRAASICGRAQGGPGGWAASAWGKSASCTASPTAAAPVCRWSPSRSSPGSGTSPTAPATPSRRWS